MLLSRLPPPPQGQAYRDCIDRYGGRHTFLGFIDFDEFFVILDDKVRGGGVTASEGAGGVYQWGPRT